MKSNPTQKPIAIIGIGCMFAKSPDLKGYLRLLMNGINGITDPPATHQQLYDCFDPDPKKADHIYCNRGGFLMPVEFDPTEFGIPPNNLEATDTSQLLGLLVAKQALEDAGYGNGGKPWDKDRCSVIIGVTGTQELVIPLGARMGHPIWRKALTQCGVAQDQADVVVNHISHNMVEWQENSFPGLLGNVVAGRIANRLDLGGTNCVVDAACASSMGALRMGILELTGGHSDMVITGGVDTINDVFMHMCFARTRILSATGDIRPFSVDADGTVLGEGVGLLVLKRLEDAERDQDRIYAVIRGIGSSSDGKSQSIYAPRLEGQAKAMHRAYSQAGISPDQVELVEAHGTGTRVGDQVEFSSLCDVFGPAGGDAMPCALGSVKSNIGHTKASAGTAGLIKNALALYHKVLPPTLKADKPDPNLPLSEGRFYLNTQLRPWIKTNNHKRTACVSAFGFGGSNFHTVLEEYSPRKIEPSWNGHVEIVAFSGPDPRTLSGQLEQWNKYLKSVRTPEDRSVYAAKTRAAFKSDDALRMVLVFNDWPLAGGQPVGETDPVHQQSLKAMDFLARFNSDQNVFFVDNCFIGRGAPDGTVACMFPGQGSQYAEMGRDIVCCFPESINVFEEAERHFAGSRPLSTYIYPLGKIKSEDSETRLKDTRIAQPALGAVSMAMFEALKTFGLKPAATCGHSYGELAALHAAGWISSADFWRLTNERGRLMAEAGEKREERGSMLAVIAPLKEIKAMVADMEPEMTLANLNSPNQGVLSGSREAITKAKDRCSRKGWRAIPLSVSAAFHSPFMANAQKPFQKLVNEIAFTPSDIQVISNTSGGAYPGTEKDARDLLGRQLANAVDFVANIQCLYDQGIRTFVEVGPKSVLKPLVESILQGRPVHALSMDRSAGRKHGLADLAGLLGALAALGHGIHLERWEKPAPARRKARMSVMLSGTNYRKPKKPSAKPSTQLKPKEKTLHILGTTATTAGSEPVKATAFRPETGMQPKQNAPLTENKNSVNLQPQKNLSPVVTMKKMDDTTKQHLQTSLSAVRQGLKSLTELQNQIAQAHQKFLDAQTQAGKTLLHIIQQAHQLSSAAMGITTAEWTDYEEKPVGITKASDRSEPTATPQLQQCHVTPAQAGLTPAPSPAQEAATHEPKPVRISEPVERPSVGLSGQDTAAEKAGEEIKMSLIAVVSELTGYPEQMLGLEMDIESDLGIDSIKRVEILSVLEEKMPELPKVTPDMMGSLKTLGQICDYLGSSAAPATPPAPAPITSAIAPAPAGGHDAQEIQRTLIAIVSELTGYPEQMLGLEMDIESDLGIDSIKRVEILSALEEKMPELPKVTPDMMGSLKTLGQICAYLAGSKEDAESSVVAVTEVTGQQRPEKEDPESTDLRRNVIHITSKTNRGKAVLGKTGSPPIGIVCQHTALAEALCVQLETYGFKSVLLSEIGDIASCGPLSGLVLSAPVPPQQALEWVQAGYPALKAENPFILTLSFIDGAFGFRGTTPADPYEGALAGLIKTAALEWPGIRCVAIDVDPDWKDVEQMGKTIVTEVVTPDPDKPLEIGLSGPDDRIILELVETPVANKPGPIDLNGQDVVVVTGGARGVTSACAIALARKTGCRLAMLGRSPEPVAEPGWLSELQSESEMKRAILENQFKNQPASPKDIESSYRKWKANREIKISLAKLSESGISARYYSVDVRDLEVVSLCLDKVREQLGPIKGLIHGAGVLEDRLITDKQLDQFQRVFETKVKGLEALLSATEKDDLKYLVFFSSVAARMGNAGQVDYAMANEVMNKIAVKRQSERSGCKVLSINWGPWDGGMVTPTLKRNFIKNEISLIPVAKGAEAMLNEMSDNAGKDVEVVIGGLFHHPPADGPENDQTLDMPQPATNGKRTSLTAKREIDVEKFPVLRSHLLNGRPVVPLALITEWLAHSALLANPGLIFIGIDDLRLFKGIILNQPKTDIRLMSGKLQRINSHYEVAVEIRNGGSDGREIIHSSAKAILSDRIPSPPDFKQNGHFKVRPIPFSLTDAYERILFHGEDLRGIKKIINTSDQGMAAQIGTAPRPETWVREPFRSHWIADPLVLDCAFQMAILWCYQQFNQVSLPSYAATYRQYCEKFPQTGVTAVLEIQNATRRKMVGRFTFLDKTKRVVARLDGYEAVMDQDLIHKFHPN